MPQHKDHRFAFDIEFQEEILRFTVTDKKEGFKALLLYKEHYFSLIEHQAIAKALKDFYRKKKTVPSKAVLKEGLRSLYVHRDYVQLILPEDKKRITSLVDSLYSRNAKDGETILEECIKFARYTELKDVVEKLDVTDYSQYDSLQRKIKHAINVGVDLNQEKGSFIVNDHGLRFRKRHLREPGYPTPFRQLNHLFDLGGLTTGQIVVVLAKEKKFKTATMVNLALGYLKMKKRVVYFDLENGEEALGMRVDQSLLDKSKKEIASGEYDKKLAKLFRKYKRLGIELVIKRMPAYRTTADDLQKFIDDYYAEFGLKFEQCFIDYVGLMAALSGKKDDTERISDAYVDIKNFAEFNRFESLWTSNHTTREGNKREGTKYLSTDTAKCLDIARHIDVMVGLNQNEQEKQAGVMRMEMIEQRNGPQDGQCFFWINMPNQKIREFNHKEVEEYQHQIKAAKSEERRQSDDL
jgi:hypothetical protein